MKDIGPLSVNMLAANLFVLLGLTAAVAGLALPAFHVHITWLAWSGAGLVIVAFAARYLLARTLRSTFDDISTEPMATIYMPLLNEGTDVWRPVKATKIGELGYMVVENPPSHEEWAFSPGHILRCEERELIGAQHLVAVAKAT